MTKQRGGGESSGSPCPSALPSAPDRPAASGELDAAALARLQALDPTGKTRLIERVVDAFASSTQRMLPQLGRAAADGDLAALRHIVHTLKSSSANVGALHLSALCSELELQIRQGLVNAPREAAEAILDEALAVERALRRLPAGDRQ